MHFVKSLLFVVGCGLAESCQSPHPAEQKKTQIPAFQPLQRLTGTWVAWPIKQHSGSYVVHINPDSTGTFTAYGYQDQSSVKQQGGPNYYFSEGSLKVHYHPHKSGSVLYIPNLEVQIDMQDARFDYELHGDTLREYDKEGYQGTLVRLHPTE